MEEPSKGRVFSPEHRAALSAAKKGKKRSPPTPQTRERISAAIKGRPFTAEHRAAISASRKAGIAARNSAAGENMTLTAHLLDRIGWDAGHLARLLGCSESYAHMLRRGERQSDDVTAWLERLAAAHDANQPPQEWRRPRFGRAA